MTSRKQANAIRWDRVITALAGVGFSLLVWAILIDGIKVVILG